MIRSTAHDSPIAGARSSRSTTTSRGSATCTVSSERRRRRGRRQRQGRRRDRGRLRRRRPVPCRPRDHHVRRDSRAMDPCRRHRGDRRIVGSDAMVGSPPAVTGSRRVDRVQHVGIDPPQQAVDRAEALAVCARLARRRASGLHGSLADIRVDGPGDAAFRSRSRASRGRRGWSWRVSARPCCGPRTRPRGRAPPAAGARWRRPRSEKRRTSASSSRGWRCAAPAGCW